MSGGATVYILRCADGSLYVGITRRTIEERLSEHALGISPGYTESRRPVTLLHAEHYERVDEAVAAEQRIKGWSRAKKVAYIRGDFDALHAFAKRRGRAVEHDPSSFRSYVAGSPTSKIRGLGRRYHPPALTITEPRAPSDRSV